MVTSAMQADSHRARSAIHSTEARDRGSTHLHSYFTRTGVRGGGSWSLSARTSIRTGVAVVAAVAAVAVIDGIHLYSFWCVWPRWSQPW